MYQRAKRAFHHEYTFVKVHQKDNFDEVIIRTGVLVSGKNDKNEGNYLDDKVENRENDLEEVSVKECKNYAQVSSLDTVMFCQQIIDV